MLDHTSIYTRRFCSILIELRCLRPKTQRQASLGFVRQCSDKLVKLGVFLLAFLSVCHTVASGVKQR